MICICSCPGDDTTVAVAHVVEEKIVRILTGPPKDMDDDERIMEAFLAGEGRSVICGGTTAKIAARYLHTSIHPNADGDTGGSPHIQYRRY